MLAGGLLIGFGENPVNNAYRSNAGMIVLGIILSAVSIVMMIIQLVNAGKSNRIRVTQLAEEKKIAFYNECVKNGIQECKSEKEIQKVVLIAQKHKMKYSDVSDLFYESKASVDKDVEKKKEIEFEAKKEEERSQITELNKFASFTGRDKRIAILSSEMAEALEKARVLRVGAQAVMSASQQKEHNWAAHAGIASGIAGPAAGLAVAADVQAENAKIREQNEANAKAVAPIMMTSYSGALDYTNLAVELQKEIETTKTKLVSNDNAQTCLSHIKFFNTKVEVSETGTCTVTTSAKLMSPMIIFDDVDAVIDGTVIAKIYDGKSLVGTAMLVLPKYGVSGETKLMGMCLFCGNRNKDYTVEYAAINLWAMER